MRLRAQKHPVHFFCVCWISKREQRNNGRTSGSFEDEPVEWLVGATEYAVAADLLQTGGRDSANTAEPDNSNFRSMLGC